MSQAEILAASREAETWPSRIRACPMFLFDREHFASHIGNLEASLRARYVVLQSEADQFRRISRSLVKVGSDSYASAHDAANGATYTFLHTIHMSLPDWIDYPPDKLCVAEFNLERRTQHIEDWGQFCDVVRQASEEIFSDRSKATELQALIAKERAELKTMRSGKFSDTLDGPQTGQPDTEPDSGDFFEKIPQSNDVLKLCRELKE